MKAIALTCPDCSAPLMGAAGIPLAVCNACSTAFDFSAGTKRAIPLLEAVLENTGGGAQMRMPFLLFEATAGGTSTPVYVMAFGISKIGSPLDDGSKMTIDGFEGETRPGRIDLPPLLSLPTAAGIGRFLALRRLDPGGRKGVRAGDVRISEPALLAVPFQAKGDRFENPITGIAVERERLGNL